MEQNDKSLFRGESSGEEGFASSGWTPQIKKKNITGLRLPEMPFLRT